jgi:TnpA family transposase
LFRHGRVKPIAVQISGLLQGGTRPDHRRTPCVTNCRHLGRGTMSSSDRQFFRSAERDDGAGDVNARYGRVPGVGFYTHVSDQHYPYSVRVMSATSQEAHYVLDGLLHHGLAQQIDTHFTETGGASDHVFVLCAILGIRFRLQLHDFPVRKFASIEPATT